MPDRAMADGFATICWLVRTIDSSNRTQDRGQRCWLGRHQRLPVAVVVSLVAVILTWAATPRTAAAHSPHDDIFAVAMSPGFSEDQTALVVSRAWVLRTTDGGVTWRRVVNGLSIETQPQALEFSATDPQVAFLATVGNGIFHSADGGQSWVAATQSPADGKDTFIVSSPTEGDVAFATGGDGKLSRTVDRGIVWSPVADLAGDISALAFDPDRPGVVVAGDQSGELHRSDDGGETWSTSPTAVGHPVTALAFVTTAGGTGALLVGTEGGGVFRSVDDGAEFDEVGAGLTEQAVQAFASWAEDDSAPTIWLSASTDGVFVSEDGGATWSSSGEGLTTHRQIDEEEYEERTNFGPLRAAEDPAGEPVLLLGGFDGLFRSTDRAASWEQPDTLETGIIVGLAVSKAPDGGTTVAVTTYLNGVHLSEDGGETWTSVGTDFGEPHRMDDRSDYYARLYSVGLSPEFASDRTMFTATAKQFLRSTDGGTNWDQIQPLVDDEGRNQFWVAVSPDFASDGTMFYADLVIGELFRSTDRGASFSQVSVPHKFIRSIELSPDFATDDTMYAAAFNGVQVSHDRGDTWTLAGSPGESVTAVGASGSPGEETILAATKAGLTASFDGGETFEEITPEGTERGPEVEALATSPAFADDGMALLSLRGLGLFRSTDGGHTFEAIAPDLLAANVILGNYSKPTAAAIVFSPEFATDRTIYGFHNTDVLRSTDGGDTWDAFDIPTARHAMVGRDTTSPRRRALMVGLPVVFVGAAGVYAVLRRRRRRGDAAEPDVG